MKRGIKGSIRQAAPPAQRAWLAALELLVFAVFALFMAPFILVVINSAKASGDIVRQPLALPADWSQLFVNVKALLSNPNFPYWSAFADSVIITAASLALITLCSAAAAWVLARSKKRWASFVFFGFVAAMVIPFQVVMLPLLTVYKSMGDFMGVRLLNNYGGLCIAYLGFGCSMTVFILHGFIKGVPLELEEAARIDGCKPVGMFFRIVLPLLQPVLVTVVILNGIWIWNDFLLPSLMLGMKGTVRTLPIAVTSFAGAYVKQWDMILTSALLAILPIVILFLFAQKYIIKGMVDGSIK